MTAARGHFNLTTTSPQLQQQQTRQDYSQWRSPIPYLFGGLAAILGLIAFALLLLACSYWRQSGHLDDQGRDAEAGEGKELVMDAGEGTETVVEEMRVVVIMAGEEKPTFLAKATPMWSGRSSYIGERRGGSVGPDDGLEKGEREMKQGRFPEDDDAIANV